MCLVQDQNSTLNLQSQAIYDSIVLSFWKVPRSLPRGTKTKIGSDSWLRHSTDHLSWKIHFQNLLYSWDQKNVDSATATTVSKCKLMEDNRALLDTDMKGQHHLK